MYNITKAHIYMIASWKTIDHDMVAVNIAALVRSFHEKYHSENLIMKAAFWYIYFLREKGCMFPL